MLTKIYAALWFTVAFAVGIIFLTGNFMMFTAVVFGFIIFGLVFMGMMSVLPASVAHPEPAKVSPFSQKQVTRSAAGVLDHLRAFKTEWLTPNGVEIRKPKYH